MEQPYRPQQSSTVLIFTKRRYASAVYAMTLCHKSVSYLPQFLYFAPLVIFAMGVVRNQIKFVG